MQRAVVVTLTEYLQTAVTELREKAYAFDTIESQWMANEMRALADHVETMLADHWRTMAQWGGEQVECCGRCRYGDGVSYRSPCPTLGSLAQLVATVTGTPIPEGAAHEPDSH